MDTPSIDVPQNRFLNKKLLVVILGFFLIILIILIVVLSSVKKTEKPVNQNNQNTEPNKTNIFNSIKNIALPKTTPTSQKLTNLQIAEKSLNWLDSFRDKNGYYYSGMLCHSDNKCDQSLTDKQLIITAMWSQYKIYKRTQKQELLTKIKEEIKRYSPIIFQSDFWHCKLLHEMYEDSIFSTEEKTTLKKSCENSLYLNIGKAKSLASDINNFNSTDIIKRLTSASSSLIISDLIPSSEREFFMYSTYSSDFVYKYFFSNNPSYLFIAKAYFDGSVSYYLSNKNTEIVNLPFLGIAAVDIYKATRNKEYIDFAIYLNDKISAKQGENITTNIGQIFLKKELLELTKSDQYNNYNINITKIIDNNLDYYGYNGSRKNNYAFHNGGKDSYYYDTRNTALMISILSDEK